MPEDKFPAVVRKSGTSITVTIPVAIAKKYRVGQTVYVTISKESS